MPQEFQVLQCYQCETFQVHQVKKTTKWQCKLCGEKQSLKKVFGRGSGKDCRCHVQKLNTIRGELKTTVQCFQNDDVNEPAASKVNEHNHWKNHSQMTAHHSEDNKWNMFVDVNNDSDLDDENYADSMYTTDATMFRRGKKRKRMNKQSINDNCKENQELENGTIRNMLNRNSISSSQNFNQANEDDYRSGIKEFPSQLEAFSECTDFDNGNQPYVNEELGTSSFERVTENYSPCAKRKFIKIDRGVSTTSSSKWSSFVTSGENSNLSPSDYSSSDNTHYQINKKMFSNKYNTNIEDFEEIEMSTNNGLFCNQSQGSVRSLNLAHEYNDAISVENFTRNTAVASDLLKQKPVETSVKPVNLGQSKSKWNSYLTCKPQSVGSSHCVPFEPKPCGIHKPLKFSVGDLTEEDFDL